MAIDAAPRIKHDVFINFRGKDTRKNFISHLRAAMERNGIDAFTDKGLRGGDEISPTLATRIYESQVSVVVFSPNYADSRWCLDELVTIMECKAAHGQTVMPVFLQGLQPTDVRKQTGAFGDGFGRLIQDARYAVKVDSWQRALKQTADLSGWASDQMSEEKIIEKLLNRVQSVVDQMASDDSCQPFIGIERVDKVESIFSLPEVRCLGLWGLPGSGKTTLAGKIFHRVSKNFDAACFIENVREFAERYELNRLRSSLVSQLLEKHDHDRNDRGPSVIFRGDIQRKLRRKRVLVILDDVSDTGQLQELIGYYTFFGPGSKVIATCRDQQVLKNVCDQVYEVQELNEYESLQLIKLHTFKQRQPTLYQMDLLKEAVKYTQGLPLALVVLGRNLFDKDITIWKSELGKLSNIPDLQIVKILKTSFDGLEDTEKSIFLDIACVMEGWNRQRIESILDGCGFYALRGIARLVDKALITISNQHEIRMHGLIKQIGQHIASHEGIKETGRPRRLWRRNDEVADMLTQTQVEGTRNIEVISMDLSTAATIKLRPKVFKKMPRLRILCFHHAFTRNNQKISLPEELKYLPDGLRYLQWDHYPSSSLPSRFNPDNLVELRMVGSHLRQLWIDEVEEPCLPSLKYVDLFGSKNLTTIPAFRKALKLETLQLSFCCNLRGLPDSIQHLVELKYIYLDHDRNLTGIPECSELTKLEILSIQRCSKIRNLPQLPPNLIQLLLSKTKIKELPPSVQALSRLQFLWLWGCEELVSLPKFCELKHLKKLNFFRCPKLLTYPAKLDDFKSLNGLFMDGCPTPSLMLSIAHLSSLTVLSCSGFKGDALPSLKGLVSLRQLSLKECHLKSLPEDIKYLTHLWEIDLSNSKHLSFIPELPPSLHYLDASNCISLQKYAHISLPRVDLGFGSRLQLQLKFLNCFDLERDARNNIWSDFWFRILFVMVPLVERQNNMYPSYSKTGRSVAACLCLPGNEVPELVKYSRIGSSLKVMANCRRRLHPHRFIFCAVVAAPRKFASGLRMLTVTCQCISMSGETFHSRGRFRFQSLSEREHTIIWCGGFSPSQFYLNEAMFQFSAAVSGYNGNTEDWDFEGMAILKCGVTPIGRRFENKCLPVTQGASSPVVEERVIPIKRSNKRERGNGDEEQPPSHKRKKKNRSTERHQQQGRNHEGCFRTS